MDNLTKIIKNELDSFYFFLKNADIFDEYITEDITLNRLRDLEKDFGIKWENLRVRKGEGKTDKYPWIDAELGHLKEVIEKLEVLFKSKYKESIQIPNLEISGRFLSDIANDDDSKKIVLRMHRQGDTYIYILTIGDLKVRESTNFSGIRPALTKYIEGKNVNEPKEIYDFLKNKKDVLSKIANDFKAIYSKVWKIKFNTEKNGYSILFWVDDVSPEEKIKVVADLTEKSKELEANFTNILKEETASTDFSLEDSFEIKSSILNKVANKVGFKFILKIK